VVNVSHDNTFQVLGLLTQRRMENFIGNGENKEHKKYKLFCAVSEFDKYIELNRHFIPNFGERYQKGESISSSLAESQLCRSLAEEWLKNSR